MNLNLSLKASEAKKQEVGSKISRLPIKNQFVNLSAFCSGVYKSLHFRKKFIHKFQANNIFPPIFVQASFEKVTLNM